MSPVTSESNITGMYEMTPTPLLAPSSTDSPVKKPFNLKEKVYDIKKSIVKFVKRKKPSIPRDIPINNPNFHQNQKFVSNRISTSKYNLVTFLPKFLFEQFSNYANVFFLFTSCIQQIPGITPTSKYTTVIPLAIVLLFSAFKEILEDSKRHRSDGETNARLTKVLRNGEFVEAPWRDIKVGDIVRVENGESFPADLALWSSSEPEGLCYIETSNLDGETNLKVKQALPETAEFISPAQISQFKGHIKSEGPNDSLYTFTGTLVMETPSGEKQYPLDPVQILLRGAVLRNTNWIYGSVIFTGHDSKLMRNANAAPVKITNVARMTNIQIAYLFLILLILSVFCSGGYWYYQDRLRDTTGYLALSAEYSAGTMFGRNILTFIILFNNLIPISLIVTLEFVKLQQAAFINNDLDMYYSKSDTPSLARTSSLVEELGQIEYIFSDKTGTLTCNQMEFKECTVYGTAYAEVVDTNRQSKLEGQDDTHYDFKTMLKRMNEDNETARYLREYFTLLAVCHTVIPEKNSETGEITYQAASPDEGALVEGAAKLGFEFVTRRPRTINVNILGKNLEYEILNICEFNSTRKRMSTVVRTPEGKIRLYCKGADTVIMERLSKSGNEIVEKTLGHLEEYACEGLRTLCMAYRDIPEDEYNAWNEQFQAAATTLVNRQDELDRVAEYLEKDLILIGSSAIEDKLQEGVPETIFTLAQAGIKIWVLTGDRQETAINIGYSCKLIQENMSVVIVNEETLIATKQLMQTRLDALESGKDKENGVEQVVLVIDGATLKHALSKECEKVFFDLATQCKAVICCRVSPLQKALVVKLVKRYSESILLAIGDGANDVSMIQAAHVGVGINGMEGLQAARSSDFAISQFRFLKKLLLVHGAWSYQRLCKLILYSFYKNIALYMTQFWYTFYNGFSGQTVYESWTNTMYNVIFTVLPPLIIGFFDQHLSARLLDRYPEMYKIGQKKLLFNVKTFWAATFNAIFHSVLLFFLIALSFYWDFAFPSGYIGGYNYLSVVLYTSVLVTVLCKAALVTDNWTKYTFMAIPISFFAWFIFFPVYGIAASYFGVSYDFVGLPGPTYGSGFFWLMTLLMPVLCLLRDYVWKYVLRMYRPRSYHIVQEIQKFNIPDYRPRMERFRKAVHKVRMIQRLKNNRGYAFSQNEGGQDKVIRSYDTTRIKPLG